MDLKEDLFSYKISTAALPTAPVEFWGLVAVLGVLIPEGSSRAGWHRQHQEH